MKVSVLMSAFNAEAYLREAIESILCQSFADFELLVIDDGSTDGTAEIANSFKDERLRFIQNETNSGLTYSLAKGVDNSRGEYIARIDADDIAMPERLAHQVAYLDGHTDCVLLGSSVIFFDEDSEWEGIEPTSHDEILGRLLFGFTMIHPSVMMRRSVMVEHGINYSQIFKFSEDHKLWSDLSAVGRLHNLPTPLTKVRVHQAQMTKNYQQRFYEYSATVRSELIARFGAKLTAKELDAFNDVASPAGNKQGVDPAILYQAWNKVFEANENSQVLDGAALKKEIKLQDEIFLREYGKRHLLSAFLTSIRSRPWRRGFWAELISATKRSIAIIGNGVQK